MTVKLNPLRLPPGSARPARPVGVKPTVGDANSGPKSPAVGVSSAPGALPWDRGVGVNPNPSLGPVGVASASDEITKAIAGEPDDGDDGDDDTDGFDERKKKRKPAKVS